MTLGTSPSREHEGNDGVGSPGPGDTAPLGWTSGAVAGTFAVAAENGGRADNVRCGMFSTTPLGCAAPAAAEPVADAPEMPSCGAAQAASAPVAHAPGGSLAEAGRPSSDDGAPLGGEAGTVSGTVAKAVEDGGRAGAGSCDIGSTATLGSAAGAAPGRAANAPVANVPKRGLLAEAGCPGASDAALLACGKRAASGTVTDAAEDGGRADAESSAPGGDPSPACAALAATDAMATAPDAGVLAAASSFGASVACGGGGPAWALASAPLVLLLLDALLLLLELHPSLRRLAPLPAAPRALGRILAARVQRCSCAPFCLFGNLTMVAASPGSRTTSEALWCTFAGGRLLRICDPSGSFGTSAVAAVAGKALRLL